MNLRVCCWTLDAGQTSVSLSLRTRDLQFLVCFLAAEGQRQTRSPISPCPENLQVFYPS